MKAVFLDFDTMGGDLDLAPLRNVVDELVVYDYSAPGEIADRIRDADIVFTNKMNLADDLLATATKLRCIGLTATGTDNIDLESAANNGIAVFNIRDYCTESVAEHVFAVLLTLTHRLDAYRRSVAAGDWQKARDPFLLEHPIRELSAMTIGVVGYGSLGRGVANVAEAFGMDVLVSARPGVTEVPGGRVGFDEVVRHSDVISLHCPLDASTRKLFGAAQFRAMKNTAILINTARGGLVDSRALAEALRTGQVAAAAVDVLPVEPPVDGDPLLEYEGDNLIVTPHIAWASNEARQNAIDQLAENVRSFLDGGSRNRVV